MQRFIIVRLLQGIIALWLLTIVVFLLVRMSGDPVYLLVPADAPAEAFEAMRHKLGLDEPLMVQYEIFIGQLARGDLGMSLRSSNYSVLELIESRLGNSVMLAAVAMFLAILLGVPLGVIAAVKRGSWMDSVARFVGVLGQSVPSFWFGIVLILIFAVRLKLLPSWGMSGVKSYVMPAFTLAVFSMAGILRLVRSSMLDELGTEYVKLARIKGVKEWLVIWKHAFWNALATPLTFAGFQFVIMIGAAIVVETVFAWPGIGRLAYEAVLYRDFPTIQGVVLVISILAISVNLFVDVLYAYIDPKIRYT